MPQLELDHLFCFRAAGGGVFAESSSKVVCETEHAALPGSNAGVVQHGGDVIVSASTRADEEHAPAESSVQLRARDGVGLAELLGAALRRDGSTKGSSSPKAAAEAATRKGAPRAESRRLPASKSAVVIGVLPAGKVVAKERRASAPGRAVARAWRRPAAGARVFASEAVGPEPVSPKVSCFGAVLSERSAAAPPGNGKQHEEEASGCCVSLATALLRGLCCRNNAREGGLGLDASESNPKATAQEQPLRVAAMSPPQPVAGFGELKRLASRRWPETMAAEERGSI